MQSFLEDIDGQSTLFMTSFDSETHKFNVYAGLSKIGVYRITMQMAILVRTMMINNLV